MTARHNGAALGTLVTRLGSVRVYPGRPPSDSARRCGSVLALVVWSGGTPLEVVPLAMVAEEDQPQRIEEERARLESRYPECDVEEVS